MRNRDITRDRVEALKAAKRKDGRMGNYPPLLVYVREHDPKLAREMITRIVTNCPRPDDYVTALGGNHNGTSSQELYEELLLDDPDAARNFARINVIVLRYPLPNDQTAAQRTEICEKLRAVGRKYLSSLHTKVPLSMFKYL